MNKTFASGGKRPMLGKGDRTRTAYPAKQQRPGRTGQHATKPALKRTGGKVRSAAVDEAGDMGGHARRTRADRRLEWICERGSGRLHPKYTRGLRILTAGTACP